MRRYPVIGFVDATIVAMAERLKIETIATTDRRHFAMVKSRHTKGYQLVPVVGRSITARHVPATPKELP